MNRKEQIKQFFTIFPCASRDQLATLFFHSNNSPTLVCTQHMAQYRKEGWIDVNAEKKPYVYFSSPLRIKKQSAKLDHWLALVDTYIELSYLPDLEVIPEKKFGEDLPIVDLIVRIDRKWVFIEVQRTKIKTKLMQKKIDAYHKLYYESLWDDFIIWIKSDYEYKVKSKLPLIQTNNVSVLFRELSHRL